MKNIINFVKSFLTAYYNFFTSINNKLLSPFMRFSETETYDTSENSRYEKNRTRSVFHKIDLSISVFRRVVLFFIGVAFVISCLGVGVGVGYFSSIVSREPIPSKIQMKNLLYDDESSATLYFDDNVKMDIVPSDIVRKNIKSSEISPWVKKAIVATEDENFYVHNGVLPKALIRAIFSGVTGIGGQTGGSTITQQLTKMQFLTADQTFKRKATEVLLAQRIEQNFSKSEILTSYLNNAPFGRNNKGQNITGIYEAAEGIFGKSAADLNLPQAAFLAGLPQSPISYTPYSQTGSINKDYSLGMKRKNIVLFRMYREGQISKNQFEAAKKYDLSNDFIAKEKAPDTKPKYEYAYNLIKSQGTQKIADYLIEQDNLKPENVAKDENLRKHYNETANNLLRNQGYQIHSTLNEETYNTMQTVTKQKSPTFGQVYTDTIIDPNTGEDKVINEPVQTGSVLLDNKTGKVISFVGGIDFSENQLNHAFDSQRSPGSSIKPMIAYAPAIEQKMIGSKTQLADFAVNFGNYAPTDYGHSIKNRFVPADEALQNSFNIPTVNLYKELLTKVKPSKYMNKMGYEIPEKDYKQLGISLGGVPDGVNVLTQASAFSTFSNQGDHITPYVIDYITDASGKVIYEHPKERQHVFSPATSYIMNDILKGVITQGTSASISWNASFDTNKVISKSGTSNDNRDNWLVGSTPGITLATWMGYDNFYGHNYNLNENTANTVQSYWTSLMNSLYTENSSMMDLDQTLKRPSTVNSTKVLKVTGERRNYAIGEKDDTSVLWDQQTTRNLTYDFTPPETSYYFGIGGSKQNYQDFWEFYTQGAQNGYNVIKKDES